MYKFKNNDAMTKINGQCIYKIINNKAVKIKVTSTCYDVSIFVLWIKILKYYVNFVQKDLFTHNRLLSIIKMIKYQLKAIL